MLTQISRQKLWRLLFICSLIACALSLLVNRATGAASLLTPGYLWSLTSALVTAGGLSLAVGGFTVAGVIAASRDSGLLRLHRLCLMLACTGYFVAVAAMVLQFHLGWRSLWELWSPRSLPAGAGVSLLLCLVLMAREFGYDQPRLSPWVRNAVADYVGTLITCLVAVVVALQQMTFIRIVWLAPDQFSPIWSGPMLSIYVFLSDICLTLALLIFAFWHLARITGTPPPAETMEGVARALTIVVVATVVLRMLEITDLRQWHTLLESHLSDYLFGLELVLLLTPALFLLNRRLGEQLLDYNCSVMVIGGVVLSRLNLAITSREMVLGTSFFPRVIDVILAGTTLFAGISIFVWLLAHDPVLTGTVRHSKPPVVQDLSWRSR